MLYPWRNNTVKNVDLNKSTILKFYRFCFPGVSSLWSIKGNNDFELFCVFKIQNEYAFGLCNFLKHKKMHDVPFEKPKFKRECHFYQINPSFNCRNFENKITKIKKLWRSPYFPLPLYIIVNIYFMDWVRMQETYIASGFI